MSTQEPSQPARLAHLDDEALAALLDGDDVDSTAAAHLEGCERCREGLAAMRAAVRGLGRAPAPALPYRFADRVAETIHKRSRGRFFRRSGRLERLPWSGLLAVLLALVVGLYVLVQLAPTGRLDELFSR